MLCESSELRTRGGGELTWSLPRRSDEQRAARRRAGARSPHPHSAGRTAHRGAPPSPAGICAQPTSSLDDRAWRCDTRTKARAVGPGPYRRHPCHSGASGRLLLRRGAATSCCECEAQRHPPARREATMAPAAAVQQSASMSAPIMAPPPPRPGRSRNISPADALPRAPVCPLPQHARSRSSRSRSRPVTTEGSSSKPFPPSRMPAPLLSAAEYEAMPDAVRSVLLERCLSALCR